MLDIVELYDRYGIIDEDDYIEAFIEEEVFVDETMISDYNEYFRFCGEQSNMFSDDLNRLLRGCSPREVFDIVISGDCSEDDEYFRFEFNDLVGYREDEIVEMMEDDFDFLRWYVDENNMIDYDEMDEAIEETERMAEEEEEEE